MEKELVIVLDFGGQYNQLIARRVRECNVYCEVKPYTITLDEIKKLNPKGIIFTGGPNSVYDEESPRYGSEIYDLGIPILGICYGSQLMAYSLGGSVKTAPVSEYDHTEVVVDKNSVLFKDVEVDDKSQTICWMSHTDILHRFLMVLRALLTHLIALWQQWKILTRNFMQHSSILRLCIPMKELRC